MSEGKVANGDFPSGSDVVSQGVALLQQKEREFEAWLNEDESQEEESSGAPPYDSIRARWEREVVIPIHDRLMTDPQSGLSIEQVRASLAEARVQRAKNA